MWRHRERLMPQRSAFLRGRIGDEAVTLTAFVIVRQILRDGHAVLADKQEAMAVFVDLHLVARTHPAPQLGLSLLVRIKVAWTQGFAQFIDVSRQAEYHRIGDGWIRVHGRAALLGKALHILPHFVEAFFARLSHPVPRIPAAP